MTWTNQTLPTTSWGTSSIVDITDVTYDGEISYDLAQITYDGEGYKEQSSWNNESLITTSWS